MNVILELDKNLCLLHSMGLVLIALGDPDREPADSDVIADLGRVISKEAMVAFDLLHEIHGDISLSGSACGARANPIRTSEPEYQNPRGSRPSLKEKR